MASLVKSYHKTKSENITIVKKTALALLKRDEKTILWFFGTKKTNPYGYKHHILTIGRCQHFRL